MSAYQPLTALKGGDKEMVSGPAHMNFGGYGTSGSGGGGGGFGASLSAISSSGRSGAAGTGLFNPLGGPGVPTPPILPPGGGGSGNPLSNPPSTSSLAGGSVSALTSLRGRSLTPVPPGGSGGIFNMPPSLQQQSLGLGPNSTGGGLGLGQQHAGAGAAQSPGVQSLQNLFLPSASTGYGASLQLPGGGSSSGSGSFNPLSLNTGNPPGSAGILPSQQHSPNSRNLFPSVANSLGGNGGSSNMYGQGSFGGTTSGISGLSQFSSTFGSGFNPNRFGSALDSGSSGKDVSGYNRNQIANSSEGIKSMLNSGGPVGGGLMNMNSMMGVTAPLGLSESEFPSLGGGVGAKTPGTPTSAGAGGASLGSANNSSTLMNSLSTNAVNSPAGGVGSLNSANNNSSGTATSSNATTNSTSNNNSNNNNIGNQINHNNLSSSSTLATTQSGGYSSLQQQQQQLQLMSGNGLSGSRLGSYGVGVGGAGLHQQATSLQQLQQQHQQQLSMVHPGSSAGGLGGGGGSVVNSNSNSNQISIGGGNYNPSGGIVGGGRTLSSVGGFGMGVGGGGSSNPSSTGGPMRIQHSQSVGGSTQMSSTNSNFSGGFYSGLIKNTEPSEFQINNEDFPALQGTQNDTRPSSALPSISDTSKDNARYPGDKSANLKQQQGIQTAPDGTVSNIPPGMIRDQFGMVGMLTLLRALETDPAIVNLAVGMDLTGLGLNLNASERGLFRTFGGPWQSEACRPQDMDASVPPEYLTNMAIQDRLAPIRLNRYGDDLLFFLFYMYCGDMFQLASCAELYNRDWRYSKIEGVWVTRAPGAPPKEKTSTYECGTYYVFDPVQWRKVTKEMRLDYETLEERPTPVSYMLYQRANPATAGRMTGGLENGGGVLNGAGPPAGGGGMMPLTNSVHTPVPSVGGMMVGGGSGGGMGLPLLSSGGGNPHQQQQSNLSQQQQLPGGASASGLLQQHQHQQHHLQSPAGFMPVAGALSMNNNPSSSSLTGLVGGSSTSSMLIGGTQGGVGVSSGFGGLSGNLGAGPAGGVTASVAAPTVMMSS